MFKFKFVKREESGGDGGDGGGGDKSWRDDLPEDIRADSSLSDYKDVAGMAKSHIDLQKMMGNSIRIPGEDAGKDDMDKFYQTLTEKAPKLMFKPDMDKPDDINKVLSAIGTPAEASKYELTEDLDGYKVSDERMDGLKKQALEAGLTKAQFNKFVGSLMKGEGAGVSDALSKRNESRSSLQKEWGSAFDDRQSSAVAILEKTGAPQELIEQAKAGELGGETLKWAHGLSTSIGTEGMEFGKQKDSSSGRLTPAEAREQIGEIMRNKEGAYWGKSGDAKSQNDARAKMLDLQRLANPQ